MTEEFKKSTANLKKAVPLMMKHRVSTTPANYALWYTYVDRTSPELNQEMDQVLADNETCPPSQNARLYEEFVADKAETSIKDLKSNIEVLLGEISSSMSDTLADTSAFSEMIDNSFSKLETVEDEGLSIEEVMGLIKQLVLESREIRHSTRYLNNQLSTASEEITRLKQQLAESQKDALFDSLSELYNRRAFDQDLQTLVESKQALCLILLDIDHFKSFNDNYGHLFGDSVIRSLGRKLQQSCRDGITAYRYGGEEFALIIPNKQIRIARQFAETLRRTIEKTRMKDKRSGRAIDNVTASFGVTELRINESAESLILRTDKLLYEAKQLGRNRVMPI